MRRIALLSALVLTTVLASKANAQATTTDPTQYVPRATVALGYDYIKANAPPAGCKCFGLNGGFVSAEYKLKFWLSAAGEVTGGHASNISTLGQDLTLTTFTAGPRVNFRHNRTVLFTQGLVGLAHGSDSYFPNGNTYSTSANSLAITAGGGLDIEFTHRLAVRAIEAQYLHTTFNNGVNTSQNQLMLGAGVVLKFHGHYAMPHIRNAEPPAPKLEISCSANYRNVEQGQPVEISALMRGETAPSDIAFDWTTDGGTLSKQGGSASVDTTSLAAGRYRVTGRASSAADPSRTAQCEVAFRVTEPRPVVIPTPPPPPTTPAGIEADRDFHQNMKDVYFDYDKAVIRPDGQQAISLDATYLVAHPQMHVLLGGYSDERGTVSYNLALGAKRAEAVRDALTAAGVAADRLEIVSYGKGVQVCTKENEACFQQNRRTTFLLRP